ncbi:MAG: PilZ domain-containing protein, partial [Myxococcales bacterium]|nr:PilZ domain-containing protein [Myxococcales bacterium]
MARGGSVEQRRSERRECRIPVEVVDGQRRCVGTTIDVSRHGLFLEVEATLQERFLVQLVLHLPDGPLTATGFVVRVAPPGARRPGVGIQFFALSAASKHRWDYFVYGLTGAHTPTPDLAGQNPEQATFLIKLRDQARLAEFVERNVARGALYMATPVIKPEGTGIVLILVHPNTEEEYVLSGSVARVCREPPKGMEVHFPPPSAAEMPPLWTFVRTGHLPRPPPKADTPPPTPREPSQDIPIDIEVEETALDESARFSWDDISDYRMVVDFELANQDTLDLRPRARPEGKKRLEITMEVQA